MIEAAFNQSKSQNKPSIHSSSQVKIQLSHDTSKSKSVVSSNSSKIDWKKMGKVNIKKLIQENQKLKQQVIELKNQNKKLKKYNSKMKPSIQSGKKLSQFENSDFNINGMSNDSQSVSAEVVLQNNNNNFTKNTQKSKMNCSMQQMNKNGVQFSDNSEIRVSGLQSSDQLQNTAHLGSGKQSAFEPKQIQLNPNSIQLKLRELKSSKSSLRKTITFGESVKDSRTEVLFTLKQDQQQQQQQQSPNKPKDTQIKVQQRKQFINFSSLGNSTNPQDLTAWLDNKFDNLTQSYLQNEDSQDKQSYLEQSLIYSNLLVSTKSALKISVRGQPPNTGIRMSDTRKKLRQTELRVSQYALINEEEIQQSDQEQIQQKKQNKQKKQKKLKNSVNNSFDAQRKPKKVYECDSQIRQEKSSEYGSIEYSFISKSLASNYLKSTNKNNPVPRELTRRNTGSDKSTQQNSQKAGQHRITQSIEGTRSLRTLKSSLFMVGKKQEEEVESPLRSSNSMKLSKKNIAQEINTRSFNKNLPEIKQNQQEFQAQNSFKKSKSSTDFNMKSTRKIQLSQKQQQAIVSLHQKQQLLMVITKLKDKIKAISLKNEELTQIIHIIRHQFKEIQKKQKDFPQNYIKQMNCCNGKKNTKVANISLPMLKQLEQDDEDNQQNSKSFLKKKPLNINQQSVIQIIDDEDSSDTVNKQSNSDKKQLA